MTVSRKFTDDDLKQLHSRGLTLREIAEKLGVSEVTVLKHARRLGLTLKRKRSDDQLSLEEPKGDSEKRVKGKKSSFLPPPSGGWPM
ncbi:MAG: HTH domain-containing protein [Candidatus Freyarchaeum deiterrae]